MKKFGILVVIALLATLFVMPASAQTITWTSGFQVQNLSTTAAASVLIYYYNQDGTLAVDPPVSDSIPAGSSKTYTPAADPFNGSVVVESTEPVVAIANTSGNYPQYLASTESFAAGGSPVSLPLIMRANAGYYTWFNVQNAGQSDAHVTVNYIPGSSGTAYSEGPITIAAGAAHTFNQRDMASLGAKFVGSAVVTSDVPVVATVMQVGETYMNMLGYNGFLGGSQNVALPLVMSNNSGYSTGIQVQNIGGGPTNISVLYGNTLVAGGFQPADELNIPLAAGASMTFLQNTGQFATAKYIGSATITSDAEPIVAIVNQANFTGVALGTAYDGFDPSSATASVSAPLIMSNNSGYNTGFQVMNVGGSPVNITVTYGANIAGTFNPTGETATIQPGDSYNSIQMAGQWGTNRYVGSATVTAAAGSQLVMIVNELGAGLGGDTFMTYNGFNY